MSIPENAERGLGGRAPRPRLRTYVLLALADGAGPAEFARPLGTIAAATRTLARSAANALYAELDPTTLRAVAAASVPASTLARALALDGRRLLQEAA